MIEASIEAYLQRQVRRLGGKCLKVKFISHAGAPDRLVLIPAFQFGAFVELKRTPDTKLEPLQARLRATLTNSGLRAYGIGSIEQVDNLIKLITGTAKSCSSKKNNSSHTKTGR